MMGERGVFLHELLLGHAQGLDVAAVVGDLGDLEDVDLQAHVRHDELSGADFRGHPFTELDDVGFLFHPCLRCWLLQ